jgi:hypothetical protein
MLLHLRVVIEAGMIPVSQTLSVAIKVASACPNLRLI